jgi:hypothetical protein
MTATQARHQPTAAAQALPRLAVTGDQRLVTVGMDPRTLQRQQELQQHLATIDERRAAVRAQRRIVEMLVVDLAAVLARVQTRLAAAQQRARQFAEQEALLEEQYQIVACQLEEAQTMVMAAEVPEAATVN